MLVVEDDPLALMMLMLDLQADGFNVDGVETVREAVQFLGANGAELDALVCDLDLRDGSDGYAVARSARTHNPAVAVLYTSGVGRPEFETRKVAGAGLSPKPWVAQEIAQRLRRLLG
ncbi:MAG TPA: response regulator [Caulobacteraceae bacterium]|nr:response regulator [Caulobacteraceae bacterium]